MPRKKKERGRPPKHSIAEQIPDTPENVARAIMTTPPPQQWKYLEQRETAPPLDTDPS